MENSSEFYYEKLRKADNPGVILASFYCVLYDIEVTRSEVIMMNKLVKTFGRFVVYFSILDMVGSKPSQLDTPYPYLFEICKRRFEITHLDSTIQARESLDKYLANIDEEMEKMLKNKKKVKIPSSKGLE